MKTIRAISAFFPCYNDENTIGNMIISVEKILKKVSNNYEIIVVNDGSKDKSKEILDKFKKKYKCLKVIHHKKNLGYGAALKTGFANSTKELIFYTDGDAQYDVAELSSLLKVMSQDVDMVNGYKIWRSDPFYRKIIGNIYNMVVKFAFNIKLKDVDCDFRIIKRHVFEKVKLISNTGIICVEMMKKIQDSGFKIKQVPVHHYFRIYGKSQFFNFKRIFTVMLGLVILWWKFMVEHE
ncbi:glycosyltransferase family 2 protein [bacterium]|nr:glycosyltransferase family 2 protein [bacterium]